MIKSIVYLGIIKVNQTKDFKMKYNSKAIRIGLDKSDAMIFTNACKGNSYFSDLSFEGYDAVMEYANAWEDMPYGTQKARDGDPEEWLFDYFDDLLNEHDKS